MDVLDSHGHDRVQPPGVEFETSLASRMAGIETRRMVRFVDPASLRMMALRSDMTPQVGRIAVTRMKAAARRCGWPMPGRFTPLQGDGWTRCASVCRSAPSRSAATVWRRRANWWRWPSRRCIAGATGISVDFTLPDLVGALAGKEGPPAPGR
jgi:ATP phosphoribosyltransferase regulatory subunit